ncbi:hypothetical protein [Undibacterium terreum]|uniref:DUF4376 domain-containing protein n=1 Tax=Undibacterium terreum TaxID=1224302 RepID=A0A916XR65_9BURK|nr:hypothetical protein [Undibacterium terreum]GGD00128.1 hypothetical protein GCM10011396_54550 [Undibacterium terreum]
MITVNFPITADVIQRIEAAGLSVAFEHQLDGNGIADAGAWVCSDSAAVQAVLDAYTLADAKTARMAEVDALTCVQFDTAGKKKSAFEAARWPVLLSQTMAYQQTQSLASCPSVVGEAAIRRIPVQDLMVKIMANAALLDGVGQEIAGISGRHRDAIATLQSFEAVQDYDIATEWPF